MKLTAYSSSKTAADIDDPQWLDDTGFARKLDFEPRSAVHLAPPSPAVHRSRARTKDAPLAQFVTALYSVQNGMAYVTGTRTLPIALRSGNRELTGLKLSTTENRVTRVDFICRNDGCGRRDHVQLSSWRTPSLTSGCRWCRPAAKRKYMVTVPANPEADRARRAEQKLAAYPIWAEKDRRAR